MGQFTRHVETRQVLEHVQSVPEAFRCYLTQPNKRIHVLAVADVIPGLHHLLLRQFNSRAGSIDATQAWCLTLRNKSETYGVDLTSLTEEADLLRCCLEPRATLFSRRKAIRFDADSRNPTKVTFMVAAQKHQGTLLNFSEEGIGLQVDRDWEPQLETYLEQGRFILRNQKLSFKRAQVVHVSPTEKTRIGLHFCELSASQRGAISSVFAELMRTQPINWEQTCNQKA